MEIRVGGEIHFVRMKGRGEGILELEWCGIMGAVLRLNRRKRECKIKVLVVEIGVAVWTW